MSYIEQFLDENNKKPFVTNLRKYNTLDLNGRKKCISSFITHIFIDSEKGVQNQDVQVELLSILNTMVLYEQDTLIEWLSTKIGEADVE